MAAKYEQLIITFVTDIEVLLPTNQIKLFPPTPCTIGILINPKSLHGSLQHMTAAWPHVLSLLLGVKACSWAHLATVVMFMR